MDPSIVHVISNGADQSSGNKDAPTTTLNDAQNEENTGVEQNNDVGVRVSKRTVVDRLLNQNRIGIEGINNAPAEGVQPIQTNSISGGLNNNRASVDGSNIQSSNRV